MICIGRYRRKSGSNESEEFNEDGGHVVAARLLLGIPGHQLVEELLHDCLLVAVLLAQLSEVRDHLLAVGHVSLPDSVAGEDDEVVVEAALDLHHLGQRGDCLLLPGAFGEELELEVAEGSREVEAAVHPPLLHVPARLLDPVPLGWQVRFVVGGERDCSAAAAEDCPRVADVGDVESVLGDQQHNRGRACPESHPLATLPVDHESLPDGRQLLLSSLALQQFVDAAEGVGQRLGKVLQFEQRFVLQLSGQHLGDVVSDLRAAVAIEDCEEMHAFGHLLADECVLHGASPALHLAGGVGEAGAAAVVDVLAQLRLLQIVGTHRIGQYMIIGNAE